MPEIVNCIYCGRDTTRKCQVCKVCMQGVSKHSRPAVSDEDKEDMIWAFGEQAMGRDGDVDSMVADELADMLGLGECDL